MTGSDITVKVKVVQEAASSEKKSDGGSRPKVRARNTQSNTGSYGNSARQESPSSEEERAPSQTVTKTTESNNPNGNGNGTGNTNGSKPDRSEHSEVRTEQLLEPKEDSSLINEAYRLFEGPGSRLIG